MACTQPSPLPLFTIPTKTTQHNTVSFSTHLQRWDKISLAHVHWLFFSLLFPLPVILSPFSSSIVNKCTFFIHLFIYISPSSLIQTPVSNFLVHTMRHIKISHIYILIPNSSFLTYHRNILFCSYDKLSAHFSPSLSLPTSSNTCITIFSINSNIQKIWDSLRFPLLIFVIIYILLDMNPQNFKDTQKEKKKFFWMSNIPTSKSCQNFFLLFLFHVFFFSIFIVEFSLFF